MNKAALFTLPALVSLACAAPTSEPVTYDEGSGGATMGSGGGVGTGGVVQASSGGAPAGSGGSLGSGGALTGSGGALAGSGGAVAAGVTCTSAAGFVANNGYGDNGSMCGFAWTTAWDTATITPPCGTAGPCFEDQGAELCGTGDVPASADPLYPGMMIGWNAAQGPEGGAIGTWTATGTGLTPTFTTTGTGQVRVVIQSGASDYCANATSGSPIPWSGFTIGCWEAGGAAFSAGMPVTAVAVQLNSTETAQTGVSLCLDGITVN